MPLALTRILAVGLRSLLTAERSNISRITDRVRLSYVDWNLHMNYASYLEVMELGRWDWGFRSGAIALAFGGGRSPVVTEVDIRYRKELRPGARFVVDTRLVGIERRFCVFQQHFIVGDRAFAIARVKALILKRRQAVDTATTARQLAPFIAPPLPLRGTRVLDPG